MHMTIKQLRVFLTVAQTLSFVQASEQLNISQPALSLILRSLEETLGGSLFTRTTRRVRLTPEGESFFPTASQLMADWDNAEEMMRQRFTLQLGKVSLAAMPSVASNMLPAILKQFRECYPGINVTVHDVLNEKVLEMVQEERVEIGIAFEPEPLTRVHFSQLYMDRFIAIVPTNSPLALKQQISWRELLKYDFITLQRPSIVRFILEKILLKNGFRLEVAFESHQLVTVGNLVATGLGVSAVPALCQTQMRMLGACTLPLINPVVEKPIGILWKESYQFSSATLALVTEIEKMFNIGNKSE